MNILFENPITTYIVGIYPMLIGIYLLAYFDTHKKSEEYKEVFWRGETHMALFLAALLWPSTLLLLIASIPEVIRERRLRRCSTKGTQFTSVGILGASKNLVVTSSRSKKRERL
jgi:hypothetical protein